MTHPTTEDRAPSDLIKPIVDLVSTGPVLLGAYSLAEIAAVGGRIDWLERAPGPAELAEAVRSLAARDLITTEAGDVHIEVRGDIGIALAFQQRSRVVLDARVTGTEPDTPWRFMLMPQPEQITLDIQIDTLGIHFYALRKTSVALSRLMEQLPSGARGTADAELDRVLAASPRTALVTVTHWSEDGARETTDLILASLEERLHAFGRDPENPERFVAQALDRGEVRRLIETLIAQAPA